MMMVHLQQKKERSINSPALNAEAGLSNRLMEPVIDFIHHCDTYKKHSFKNQNWLFGMKGHVFWFFLYGEMEITDWLM